MEIRSVGVLGAGQMGLGIAQAAARAGYDTFMAKATGGALDAQRGKVEKQLQKDVERGKLTAADQGALLERLRWTTHLHDLANVDLVIESIVEELPIKRDHFGRLDEIVQSNAIFATNTSTLTVTELAASTSRPARFLGLHFFNPVHAMKLVEVVTHPKLGRDAIDRATAFARFLGKEPIVVRDSPGFASSRLGVVLGLEAMRMLEQGVASAEDIDKAMELGYNHPMGPLKLTDLVGLDVRLAIAEHLHKTLGAPHYEPPKILRDKVKAGELGKKTGKGFYTWSA